MSPFVFVIFGATGDLARNKLFPALFKLFKNGQLGDPVRQASFDKTQDKQGKQFYIIGFARRPFTNEEFRKLIGEMVHPDDQNAWGEFIQNIYYQQGLFDQEKGYLQLIEKLNTFDQEVGACITRVFYLATQPDNYETILGFLQSTKLSEGCGQGSSKWTRVAIEKPFGKDLKTAQMLDKKLATIFDEKQIFRVDHYLGKETVQNMIAFRFANGIFEPVWNNKYIDHVQVTWDEKEGIKDRGDFFDGVGILRDVAQNHLMQLVAAVSMEQPKSFSKEDVRDARAGAIKAIECINPEDVSSAVVRGQYEGYRHEKNVSPNSTTETFAAMKFFVNTPRFTGVPFYVRAGKKMAQNLVEINIVFIQTCHILFKEYGCPEIGNVLKIRIQPDEGIGMRVIAKRPGGKVALETVDMKFSYEDEFGVKVNDAYEKVLMDILSGDQMLFNRSDELESSWEFITKILQGWKQEDAAGKKPIVYASGTWGPAEANELIEKDGRKWL